MRTDWISRTSAGLDAAALAPTLPPLPTKGHGSPLAQKERPLPEILKERENMPPAETRTNPTGAPAPAEPMSLKELSGVMESAAKALLDSKLSLEKANVALSKVQMGAGPSATDKEIAAKTQGYAAQIEKIGNTIEALAKEIGAYRESVSKPRSPWLE